MKTNKRKQSPRRSRRLKDFLLYGFFAISLLIAISIVGCSEDNHILSPASNSGNLRFSGSFGAQEEEGGITSFFFENIGESLIHAGTEEAFGWFWVQWGCLVKMTLRLRR